MGKLELKEYLGCGVDIFRFDPWAPRFKTRILEEEPDTEETPIDRGDYKETYADNLLELGHELGVDAGLKGSYAGVTASVKTKFKRSEQRSVKTHFMKISFTHSGWKCFIVGGPQRLKELLDGEFKTALNSGNPDELINEYGTHVVRVIRIGGRAEYFCQSSATSSMTREEFEIAAKAKYDSLGGVVGEESESPGGSVGVSSRVRTVDTTKIKNVVGNESIDTIGGSAAASMGIKSKRDWDGWTKSIEDRPAFLGFEEDALLPIWELTSDNARRDAIKEAYKRKAAKTLHVEIISFTSAAPDPHPTAYVRVPNGYKLVSGGARVNCQGAGNFLTASFPDGNNVWRARAKHHEAEDPATITVYAVALYDPDDIWEVKVVSSRPSKSGNLIEQDAAVDSGATGESGYVLVGGGAKVDYGSDQAGNLLYTSQPYEGKWLGQAKDQETASSASITAYAVGLKLKVTGIKVEAKTKYSRSSSATKVTEEASPESGYVMIGGGASLSWDNMTDNPNNERNRGLELTGSYPKDSDTWKGEGKDQWRHRTQGFIDVYAIGLKVV